MITRLKIDHSDPIMGFHKTLKKFLSIQELRKQGYVKRDRFGYFMPETHEIEIVSGYRTDVPYSAARLERKNQVLFPMQWDAGVYSIDETHPVVMSNEDSRFPYTYYIYQTSVSEYLKWGKEKCFVMCEEFAHESKFFYLSKEEGDIKIETEDPYVKNILSEKLIITKMFKSFSEPEINYINPLNFIDPTLYPDRVADYSVFEYPQTALEYELGLVQLDVCGEEDFRVYRNIHGFYVRQFNLSGTSIEQGEGKLFYGWEHLNRLYWRTETEYIKFIYEYTQYIEGVRAPIVFKFKVLKQIPGMDIRKLEKFLDNLIDKVMDRDREILQENRLHMYKWETIYEYFNWEDIYGVLSVIPSYSNKEILF